MQCCCTHYFQSPLQIVQQSNCTVSYSACLRYFEFISYKIHEDETARGGCRSACILLSGCDKSHQSCVHDIT